MQILRITALLGLILAVRTAEAQQVVQSAQATASPPTVVTTTPLALLVPSADMALIYRQRGENIRLHHRPTPLEAVSPQAFSRALQEAPPPPPPTNVALPSDAQAAPLGLTAQLVTNRELSDTETNNITSLVSEPSIAVRGPQLLLVANWFSAFSNDAGQTFAYADPGASFSTPPNEVFCCDQLAYYHRGKDLMVWVLQYVHPQTQGTNRLRIAVARGNDITTRSWRFYDFTPQNVGGWTAEWFDYPALAATEKFLYLTTNSFGFGASGSFSRAVLLRLPLEELASYQGFNYQHFATSEVGSLRPVHGASTTMYIASNRSTNEVRIHEWPEASSSLNIHDINVAPWSRINVSVAGTEWLNRADGRITAGWFSSNQIGVAWTGGRDNTFPHAHIRVVRIDPGSWAVVDQPHIWNSTFPFAYPTAAPNAAGQVGIGLTYGTIAGLFPSHAVGVRDDSGNAWRLVVTAQGTHTPNQPVWGDYFTMGLHGQNAHEWVTAGFASQGGSASADVVLRYVHFRAMGFVEAARIAGNPQGATIPSFSAEAQEIAPSAQQVAPAPASSPEAEEIAIDEKIWSQLSEEDKRAIVTIITGAKLVPPDVEIVPKPGLAEKRAEVDAGAEVEARLFGLKKKICTTACEWASIAAIGGCATLSAGLATVACTGAAKLAKDLCIKRC